MSRSPKNRRSRLPDCAKNKNNRVLDIEQDGEYLTVQFERANGEVVIGMYKNFGWKRMPSQELEKFLPIINSYPKMTIGRRLRHRSKAQDDDSIK